MGLQPGEMFGLVELAEADGCPLAGTLLVVLLNCPPTGAGLLKGPVKENTRYLLKDPTVVDP